MLKFVKARDNPSGGAPIIVGEFLHNGADTWSPADWQMMLEETRLNPFLRGTVVAAGIEHLAPIGIGGGEVTYQMAASWLGGAWVDPYSPKGAISVTTVPSLDSPYVPPEESAPAPSSPTLSPIATPAAAPPSAPTPSAPTASAPAPVTTSGLAAPEVVKTASGAAYTGGAALPGGGGEVSPYAGAAANVKEEPAPGSQIGASSASSDPARRTVAVGQWLAVLLVVVVVAWLARRAGK